MKRRDLLQMGAVAAMSAVAPRIARAQTAQARGASEPAKHDHDAAA